MLHTTSDQNLWKRKKFHVTEPVLGRKTLNSLRARLTKESDFKKAFKEFQKLNLDVPINLTKSKGPVKSKPSDTSNKPKGDLEVKCHGIKKRKPRIVNFSAPSVKKYLT